LNSIKLKPIYGWGWFLAGGKSTAVPSELTIEVEAEDGNAKRGIIKSPHEYKNQIVVIELRSQLDEMKHFNVFIYNTSNEIEVTGFAELMY
jgi:hypothetical protein